MMVRRRYLTDLVLTQLELAAVGKAGCEPYAHPKDVLLLLEEVHALRGYLKQIFHHDESGRREYRIKEMKKLAKKALLGRIT